MSDNLPPMSQEALDAVLSEWDSKIDRKLDDARGVRSVVDAIENAKQQERAGVPPEQIYTRRPQSAPHAQPNGSRCAIMMIVPPIPAPHVLEVRAADGSVIDSETLSPSQQPQQVPFDDLPPGQLAVCLMRIVTARKLDMRPGRFKVKL